MKKSLLFIGGGIETIPGVLLAQEMGYQVLVSDRNPNAPCFEHADVHFIADTYSPEENIEVMKLHLKNGGRLDGVICLASDIPYTVARVAEAFGLPGIHPDTAKLVMDKLAMKDCFAAANLPIPFYQQVHELAALKQVIAAQGLPMVVKPVDSRGARGVLRLTETVDLSWAYDYAKSFSPTGRVMVESYLEGPQLSTESLVIDGVAYTPGISDRNYELLEKHAPFFIENGGDLPTFLPQETVSEVTSLIGETAKALGIENGVIKGDLVIHQGKAHLIEVAARLSGGYFCSHLIPLNTGVAFVRWAIALAMGESFDPEVLTPRQQHYVSQRYLFSEPGVVKAVHGAEAVAQRPEIAYCEVRVLPGDTIAPIENHPGRPGVLTAIGKSREDAIKNAEAAVRSIHIDMEP